MTSFKATEAKAAKAAKATEPTRRAIAIVFAGPLLGLALTGCSNKASDAPRTRPPPMVAASKVIARDVPIEVRAPVELKPLAQADVGSKTLGILDAVLVDRGDKVKRGDLIALVRPSDLPGQLTAARSAMAQTEAALSLARANADRAKQLAPSGVVSQQELSLATSNLAQAEAAQATARAQAGVFATRLGETRIESPMEGLVATRRLDPGAIVGPPGGGAIVTIVKIDVLRVFISVTERDLTRVKLGQDAHVELDSMPDRPISGKVVRIAPVLDPTTRSLDAEVQISNSALDLRPGMFGRGAIVVDVHPHAVVIPANAIQLSGGRAYAYVVVGDKVERRALELGFDEGNWLEILSGIREGEDVVTAGADGLSNGATVRVSRGIDPFSGRAASSSSAAVPASSALKRD